MWHGHRCDIADPLRLDASADATPRPTPSATPPRVERLKAAVQLENEQTDPILMTVIYAAQYVPVYEALVEKDPYTISCRCWPPTDT